MVVLTGAGGSLGRQHALALAVRGEKVVVNDWGGSLDGQCSTRTAAQAVVGEIRAASGVAMANGAAVTDVHAVQAMVTQTLAAWGPVDILVNNASILRDKIFSKMDLDDFRLVTEMHLMGAVNCYKAELAVMRTQNYGRIVMTPS